VTARSAISGFTIIEIAVVLVIMAGIAALALPNLIRLYDAVTERATLDELVSAARSASVYAYSTGRQLKMVEYLEQQVDLPEGWHVSAQSPILIGANGICRGGRLFIVAPSRSLALNLTPPFCQPEA
jgi:general secretion pathway protein G